MATGETSSIWLLLHRCTRTHVDDVDDVDDDDDVDDVDDDDDDDDVVLVHTGEGDEDEGDDDRGFNPHTIVKAMVRSACRFFLLLLLLLSLVRIALTSLDERQNLRRDRRRGRDRKTCSSNCLGTSSCD